MKHSDPVGEALALLRKSGDERQPDPQLEAKLRARFGSAARSAWSQRPGWLLALLGLTGAAAAGSGALGSVRGWWAAVEIGGAQTTLPLENGKAVQLPFATKNGVSGVIEVQRDSKPGQGERTRIDIESQGPGSVSSEELDEFQGKLGSARLTEAALEGSLVLISGHDHLGHAFQIYVQRLGPARSRILLQSDHLGPRSVTELANLPFDLLSDDAEAEATEVRPGEVELSLSDGHGAVLEFSWSSSNDAQGQPFSELHSGDGSVRVLVPRPSSPPDDPGD